MFHLLKSISENCHHQRAWQYYVESIEKGPTSFISTACNSETEFNSGECAKNQHIPMGEALKKSM